MGDQVRVEDLEVFAMFRAAVLKFAQAVDLSLSNADSQISRTHSWLENEQSAFWVSQLRKREETAAKARDAVRAKKLYKDFAGQTRDASQEEKDLAKCVRAVEEAKEKIELVRKWLPRLEKASDMYRGGVSHISKTITSDVPRAIALLDRLAMSLQDYMLIESPAMPTDTVASGYEESMGRGAAAEEPAPPPPATNAPPPPAPAQKEAGHDAAGQ